MVPDLNIPDFDPRVAQAVMKAGGKKKLDALIGIMNESMPLRLQDLKEASSPALAKTAAQALKVSAGNLGLARLEDLCDQILASGKADPGLIKQAPQAFEAGRKALLAYRAGI